MFAMSVAALMLVGPRPIIGARNVARATMPTPKPDTAAEPKPMRQVGLRQTLYVFVVPTNNPQTS
jgi:hypothetical protein